MQVRGRGKGCLVLRDLLQLDEDDFVVWATERAVPRPPNHLEIVKANMGRPETPADLLARLELGPNRCSAS